MSFRESIHKLAGLLNLNFWVAGRSTNNYVYANIPTEHIPSMASNNIFLYTHWSKLLVYFNQPWLILGTAYFN